MTSSPQLRSSIQTQHSRQASQLRSESTLYASRLATGYDRKSLSCRISVHHGFSLVSRLISALNWSQFTARCLAVQKAVVCTQKGGMPCSPAVLCTRTACEHSRFPSTAHCNAVTQVAGTKAKSGRSDGHKNKERPLWWSQSLSDHQ